MAGDEDMEEAKGRARGSKAASSKPSEGGGKQKTRRGGRKARKNAGKEFKLTVRDRGLRQMLVALSKLSLQDSNRTRMLWGHVVDVAIIAENHAVVQAIADEGEAFHDNVE